MDAIMETVNTPNTNLQNYFDSLKSKTDIIIKAAQHAEINQQNSLASTALLNIIMTNGNGGAMVGIAFLLSVQSSYLPEGCSDAFVVVTRSFFEVSSKDQIMAAHKEVSNIVNKLTSLCSDNGNSKVIIGTLLKASKAMAPSPTCLTPAHSCFLQACIAAQMYGVAVNFIRDTDVLEVDPKNTSLTAADYLNFIAVKDYGAALDAFTQAITMPASALSHIVVSSIKKAKLVALIHRGQTLSLPHKLLSSLVSRFLGQELPVYDDIEKCFLSANAQALFAVVNDTGYSVLQDDLNQGLAKQALEALTAHRVRRLTKTFVTLSLGDIAAAAGLADPAAAEKLLVAMSRDGRIRARIDSTSGMVRFGDDHTETSVPPAGVCDSRMCGLMERSIDQTMALSTRLRELQKGVLVSSSHVLRQMNNASGAGGNLSRGGGGGGSYAMGGSGGSWGGLDPSVYGADVLGDI